MQLHCRNATREDQTSQSCDLLRAPPCRKSFERVEDWVKDIRLHGPAEAAVVLVGNKADRGEDLRAVTSEQITASVEQLGLAGIQTWTALRVYPYSSNAPPILIRTLVFACVAQGTLRCRR